MNKQEKYLLTLGALIPLTTFASGGAVLEWVWVEFFVIVAFAIALTFAKINWTGKGLMIFIFIVTEFLAMKLTDDLPYSKNALMINLISIIAPTLTTIASYWILQSRFKKKIN